MDTFPAIASAELRLLLGLVRACLTETDRKGVQISTEGVKWPAFDACVNRHALGAFLHARVAEDLKSQLPPQVTHRWRVQAQFAAQRSLAQAAEIIRLSELLGCAGIAAISVKGPLLARDLYGSTNQRRAGDIDMLVAVADTLGADALMRRAGYVRTRPDFALTPRQESVYRRVHYEYEYVTPASQMRLELMWRLEGLPDQPDLWRRAVPRPLGNRTILTLPDDLNACYLFQHGARHGWYRLFWLLDVALLLRDERLDWSALIARARSLGIERPVLQGAGLAADLLGAPLPPALIPAAAEHTVVAHLSREAVRQMQGATNAGDRTVEWIRQLVYRVNLRRGVRQRAAVLRPHLISLSSWKMLRLPDALFGLYHPLTPFLWLWRRCRR